MKSLIGIGRLLLSLTILVTLLYSYVTELRAMARIQMASASLEELASFLEKQEIPADEGARFSFIKTRRSESDISLDFAAAEVARVQSILGVLLLITVTSMIWMLWLVLKQFVERKET